MVWCGRNEHQVYLSITRWGVYLTARNSILLVSGHQDLLARYADSQMLNDKPKDRLVGLSGAL